MTVNARGPYRTGIEKRKRIVENAVRVFGDHGYRGGSLRMIASAVGAPASQIIALFGSKDGLLTAVLDRWDNQQVDEVTLHGLDYVNTLRERIAYSYSNPQWIELLLTLGSEATAADHPAHTYFVDRYERIADRLQAEILEAARTGDIARVEPSMARVEAQKLSAMMDGLQLQWLLNRQFDMVPAFNSYLDDVIARWKKTTDATPSLHAHASAQ